MRFFFCFCAKFCNRARDRCYYILLISVCFSFCSPGALQISDSQETDQGKYECVAENSLGTQHATAITLWVRGQCIIIKSRLRFDFFSFCFHVVCLFLASREICGLSYAKTMGSPCLL